jgi:small subunit ribosomal protein S8
MLKNAAYLKKELIVVPWNKKLLPLINLLYKEMIIQSFHFHNTVIKIYLKYFLNMQIFYNLKFLSTSSQKNYLDYLNLCLINSKNSFFILSTDKGLLTEYECKQFKIGGKLLFSF